MTLRAVARKMLNESDGDVQQAIGRIETALSDPVFQDEIRAHLLGSIRAELLHVHLEARDRYRVRARPSESVPSSGRMAWMTSELRWMDFPMPGGRTLGEYTKADLEDLIIVKTNRIDTEVLDVAFYREISAALNSSLSTVKSRLKEADLRQMRQAVELRAKSIKETS